jgi:hypothetical protein
LNQADITAKTQPKECCLNIQDLQIVQVIFARLLSKANPPVRGSADAPDASQEEKQTMKQTMKLNKIGRIGGMAAALLGSVVIPSFALPTSEVEVVYFRDATYSREVGYVFRGCQGGVIRQGTTSRYQVRSSTPCLER